MTTEQEKERERLHRKYTDDFGTSIPYKDMSLHAPYLRGWQINVRQMRDRAQSGFLKDGDMENFQKENREIDRYARRMKKLYGIGLPPGGKDDELTLDRHEHRCRVLYAKWMARANYAYARPSEWLVAVEFQRAYENAVREARAAYPAVFAGMDTPMPDLREMTEETYCKVMDEWRIQVNAARR